MYRESWMWGVIANLTNGTIASLIMTAVNSMLVVFATIGLLGLIFVLFERFINYWSLDDDEKSPMSKKVKNYFFSFMGLITLTAFGSILFNLGDSNYITDTTSNALYIWISFT